MSSSQRVLEDDVFKPLLLVGIAVVMGPEVALAQGVTPRRCLHATAESAADRSRREQAIDYIVKVNLAESARTLAPHQYRPLKELGNLPPVPAGFDVQFHYDDRSYAVSLKDTRDACRYAIFSDQDGLIYEGEPRAETGRIVPLGTR